MCTQCEPGLNLIDDLRSAVVVPFGDDITEILCNGSVRGRGSQQRRGSPLKRASLADFCCPACRGELSLQQAEGEGEHIREGALACASCEAEYPIRGGIPCLLVPGEDGRHDKADEMEGWVSLWTQKGMYERPDYESSLALPYLPGAWHNVAVMFDLAMRDMALTGHETILDLAAGQGWAARRFVEKGCRAFAADIVADEIYGLGRAWGIMEHAGVYFEPLLADGEQLPFASGTFDIVFICGGLHHFQHFGPVLAEARRVLKPGGRFVATGEPALALAMNEQAAQAEMEETKVGIVERRPKVFHYWWALKRAGFVGIRVESTETYRRDAASLRRALADARRTVGVTIRPAYRPLAWLGLTVMRILPSDLAEFLLLCIQGGRLLIKGYAPART